MFATAARCTRSVPSMFVTAARCTRSVPSIVCSDAALRPPLAAVQCVKDASKDMHNRLQHLGALSCPPLGLFSTRAHMDLASFLLHHLEALARPQGFPSNGVHGRTIVGSQGIGKSTVLRHIVQVSQALHSNVVAVYVSCTDNSPTHILEPVALHLLAAGVIDHRRDVESAAVDNKLHDLLMTSLYLKKKKLLLVVDDMEQLYRCNPGDVDTFVAARRSLSSLASIGERGGSVCSVLLCGNSFFLPLLITANGSRDAAIVKEYPTVYGAPSLNGQRFSEVRIPGGLPIDLDMARAVCRTDDAHARVALFVAGSMPPLLHRVPRSLSSHNVELGSGDTTSARQVFPLARRSRAFHAAVMTALRRANADVMKLLRRKNGAVSTELVAAMPWETMVQPLRHKQLARLWKPFAGFDDVQPMEPTLQAEIFRLCDMGFLAQDVRNTEYGMPNAVYPATMRSLFHFHLG